ncbi:L-fuculose phosphate aldolase [Anaerobiospirillum thomasii]|uniref:class II aldolase/adducin family protein n=1 Tax=Anaerobiospirillum thomasii TaxID=179995 RepID=UPI000D85EB26|nr:class II aldolase/adducin family protein [Anaerobiospirillum thomasii]SPT67555.1 L-fuculose phosphate aldolase [Anaerobiospirillum thomasii]SPT71250.1 L-fuculose phosphate aldolase [Anaerobiospirillum thomasii]
MLDSYKNEVLVCSQNAERSGLCKHRSGNFSVRVPDSDLICITASGFDRMRMTERDIVVMDLEGRVVEALTNLKPTSEALMHIAIYKDRQDVHAIAHTHSTTATAFSVLNKPIPAIIYELSLLNCKDGNTIPVAKYGRPGTKELADNVIEALKDSDVALMQQHGTIAVHQDSLHEAVLRCEYMEELARMYLTTLTVLGPGREPPVVPQSELQKWEYPKEIILPSK